MPLDPPDTLQRLFRSFTSWYPLFSKIPLFLLLCSIPRLKKSTKGSFLVSTIAHTIYLTTTCVVVALIAPQVYLACKHKKLKTLVAALTLQRIPSIQALSVFKILGNTKKLSLYAKILGYQLPLL